MQSEQLVFSERRHILMSSLDPNHLKLFFYGTLALFDPGYLKMIWWITLIRPAYSNYQYLSAH